MDCVERRASSESDRKYSSLPGARSLIAVRLELSHRLVGFVRGKLNRERAEGSALNIECGLK